MYIQSLMYSYPKTVQYCGRVYWCYDIRAQLLLHKLEVSHMSKTLNDGIVYSTQYRPYHGGFDVLWFSVGERMQRNSCLACQ